MTLPQTPTPFTKAEMIAVVGKLEAWSLGLPVRERIILAALLAQTRQAQGDDATGHLLAPAQPAPVARPALEPTLDYRPAPATPALHYYSI